jgi:hypothetical protein
MMEAWATFWTVLWFAGLGIFSGLALMVTVFGARDLVALLESLKRQHELAQESER